MSDKYIPVTENVDTLKPIVEGKVLIGTTAPEYVVEFEDDIAVRLKKKQVDTKKDLSEKLPETKPILNKPIIAKVLAINQDELKQELDPLQLPFNWLKINMQYLDGGSVGDLFKKVNGIHPPNILKVKNEYQKLINNNYELFSTTMSSHGNYLFMFFRKVKDIIELSPKK